MKKSRAGLGLFAVDIFKKGEFVIEYTGEMLTEKEFEASGYNKYFFEIDKHWTVDGSSRENIARYINHACRPNCEVRIYAQRIRIWTIAKNKTGRRIHLRLRQRIFQRIHQADRLQMRELPEKKK